MLEPQIKDKRPIAKFYRCWLEDVRNGIAIERCRGINQEQFRAANRLTNNYDRAFLNPGSSFVRIGASKTYSQSHKIEIQLQALHSHRQVFTKLSKKSQEIIEHFCLLELSLRQFELKQVPKWPKGVGSARLREALDDLVEIYRQ